MPNAVSTGKSTGIFIMNPNRCRNRCLHIRCAAARAHGGGLDVWAASGGPDSERRRLECGSRELCANSGAQGSEASKSTNLASRFGDKSNFSGDMRANQIRQFKGKATTNVPLNFGTPPALISPQLKYTSGLIRRTQLNDASSESHMTGNAQVCLCQNSSLSASKQSDRGSKLSKVKLLRSAVVVPTEQWGPS